MADAVKVGGLREFENNLRTLRELFDVKTGGLIIRALRAGARVIRDEAKRRAPLGKRLHFVGRGGRRSKKPGARLPKQVRGGLMRAHIVEYAIPVSSARAGGRPTVILRVSNKGYELLNGKVRIIRPGSSPGYWSFVEFGTSRTAAKPFMRPAFESKKYEALATFHQELGREISKAFSKASVGMRKAA